MHVDEAGKQGVAVRCDDLAYCRLAFIRFFYADAVPIDDNQPFGSDAVGIEHAHLSKHQAVGATGGLRKVGIGVLARTERGQQKMWDETF